MGAKLIKIWDLTPTSQAKKGPVFLMVLETEMKAYSHLKGIQKLEQTRCHPQSQNHITLCFPTETRGKTEAALAGEWQSLME
jgi:hypothetical protein